MDDSQKDLTKGAWSVGSHNESRAAARDRDRSRRPARPGRAAATVLVVGLVLLGAAAAEAQTERILVTNVFQTADDSANTSGNDHAQLFHTGANTDGYILTSVLINSDDVEDDDFDVEICGADTTANEFPTTDCTALTPPASFVGVGNVPFTHTGLALSANTNYVVVIKQRGTGSVELDSTTSSAEDSQGLSDWSIKNKFYWKSGSTWMIKSGSDEALTIVVYGYEVLSTDATLSALSVSGATLSPAFAAGTTDYSTTVANSVSQVTITETKSESTATLEYLDGSDTTLTDADTMTAGLQVNLSVGTNTVKVKVTAPDTTTTETYTVNVFRAAVPVACSAASMSNRIWTGNLTAEISGSLVGFDERLGNDERVGNLDNTSFSYEGTSYTIDLVQVTGGAVFTFSLDAGLGAAANDLVLHVGAQKYPLADATYAFATNSYVFYTNVPAWANGDAVCLALTVEGPAVSSVEITSTPTNATYAIGDAVEATVTFDAAVDITGSPQLELDFDGTAKAAACTAATNTTTMACSYTVAVGDSAPNGIAIAANKLTGGTIYATGSTTTNADLDHVAVAIDAGHKVDGIRPTLVTTGTDAPTTSTDGAQVILTFSETLSTADRTKITIGIGGGNVAQTSAARVAGTTVELDLSTIIDATVMLTVALDADAVEDGASNGNLAVAATAVINAIGSTTAPTVTAVALTSAPDDATYGYKIGDAVEATVTFSAAVDITGSPQLELDFDGTAKAAACTAATNTTTMACSYTVAVAIDAGQKVDGIRPTLVTTGTDAPTTSTDGTKVILTFSEDIEFVNRSLISILANGATQSTTADSRAGTKAELTLATALTATATNLTVALAPNSVFDAAGNSISLVLATGVTNAVGSTTAPTVTGIALTSTPTYAAYHRSEGVEATVTFDAAVDITGSPQLELDFDGTAKAAACTAATNTTAMVCSYTVAPGDSAPNGIAIAANKLTGGTITATGDTTISADLDHAAVPIDANHKVDGIRPTLVTTGSEAPTTSTDGTTVILTFSEDIRSVNRNLITIQANGATLSTTAESRAGNKAELTLATALPAAATNLTVSLATNSVFDDDGNGILAVAATAVTNAVVTPDPPGTLKARRGDGEVHLEWVPVAAVPTDPDRAYQLRYGAAGGESNQWRDIPGSAPGGPNARSYTVTGLENGTRYAFELRVRRDSGVGTAAKIRQTPEAARWSVSTNRRSVHEGEDVTLSIATSNAVGFYSAPEVLTLAVMAQIVLEFATIDGADPEDFEIRVDGHKVQGYTKDITLLNFDKDLAIDPFPAQHFDVAVPVGSTSLDVTVTVLADEEEDGQEHMSFMVFRGEELVNEDTWEETGVNIESRDAGVVKQLAVADAEATEGEDPSLDFVVTLAPAAAWTVTVDYATRDGTARAGSDYTDTSGALTFAPGETAKTVSVPVIDDTVEDTPETLTVRLSNANPPYNEEEGAWEWGSQEAGVLIADAVATGTIRNTETAGDLSADVPESAFTSKRHTGSDDRPQVAVAFSEAVAEFAANTPSVSVTGASGVSVQTHTEDGLENAYVFFMTPDGDGDVTFALTTNAACAAGGICTADGTVLTQVPAAWTIPGPSGDSSSLSVADAEATEEEDSTMAFVVTLDPAASDTVTVDYATSDGSAAAGNDYTATSGTLSFSAGETRKTISVAISDDTDNEGDETFTVTLSNAAGADLGTQAATGTIRNRPVAPLTASFSGVPAEHDGSEFTVDLSFSENVAAGYARIRDHAFSVNGANIKNAQRKTQGSNQNWTVTVDPTDNGGVSITLPETTNCSAQGAICTEDGRRLSNSSSATVAGPAGVVETTPTVSIAGGSGTEGDDGSIAFTVTLDEAASGTVTVDYATADGSAEAGDDYTAASGTLSFAAGETSKTISVAIDDDIDNESDETFTVTLSNAAGADLGTQAATGTIRNRPVAPLTASFSNMPAEHDGSAFTFDLSFSENVAAGYARIRDHAFSVNGATIKKAQRKTQGSNQNWTVTVDPTGNGGVSITLPETTTCHNAGGICTDDGRKLNHSTSDSVQGPVGIAVSDARVEEAAGAVLAFAVTLSRSASSPITINYATSDGSATAGADYTAASGILTIESGRSSGSIEVTVLDDSHNDGDETLTLSNASSGVLTDATATGTIENYDAMPRALMARFGRTAALHVVEQVQERIEAPRETGIEARFAGRAVGREMVRDLAAGFLTRLGGSASAHGDRAGAQGSLAGSPAEDLGAFGARGLADGASMAADPMGSMPGTGGGMNPRGGGMGFGGGNMQTGSAFVMNHETRRGGILSFWSRGAQSQFAGREGELSLDGRVRTTMFGADYAKGSLITGLSLSHSRGLGGYTGVDVGEVTSSVTGLYPWAGYKVSDRITLWGVTGYGKGALTLTPGAGAALESGLSMALAAGGLRGELADSVVAGFGLAFKADALWVGTAIDGVEGPGGNLAATSAAVTRYRTALEASRGYRFQRGLSLQPSLEVGLRRDGGDAETGAGVDIGGGLIVSDALTGLSANFRVRMLLAHQDEEFRERGMSVSFGYNPTPSTPLGFLAKLTPSWGGQAESGAQALWGRDTMAGMADGGPAAGGRLEAELGYGMPVGGRLVGMPSFGIGASGLGRDYRLGYGLTVAQGGATHFDLGVYANRRESPSQGTAEHGVLGRLTARW